MAFTAEYPMIIMIIKVHVYATTFQVYRVRVSWDGRVGQVDANTTLGIAEETLYLVSEVISALLN